MDFLTGQCSPSIVYLRNIPFVWIIFADPSYSIYFDSRMFNIVTTSFRKRPSIRFVAVCFTCSMRYYMSSYFAVALRRASTSAEKQFVYLELNLFF